VGLAVSDFAKQRKLLFLAAEPLSDKLVWEGGNRYNLPPARIDLHADGDADPEAARLKKKRWALVYPNYEYGQSGRMRSRNC